MYVVKSPVYLIFLFTSILTVFILLVYLSQMYYRKSVPFEMLHYMFTYMFITGLTRCLSGELKSINQLKLIFLGPCP